MDLKSFSHGYGQCAFHIVLVPKYRHRIFVDLGVKSCCEASLRETAFRVGCEVYALQVGVDHVHVFVGLHPSCSVSELIRLLKCNSARCLFLEYPELKLRFWYGSLWSRGKFYRSIGQVNAETIKRYIEESKHQ
ncbi:MAG: IS200/IS605 family transposase [Candidatus Bathyarchaeota archaeon]|nr:IS200/IS605 family transposase [Candidatus Bathyarchaeota archaeon]MDT8781984.1 IS200/IS605 family transposase [Candidatus Bathyarchaeota archaeon]